MRDIEISANKVDIHYGLKFPISEDSHFELFLCCLLDLSIGSNKQDIVYGSCKEAKDDHQHSENGNILEDIDQRDQILEDEERLSHDIEQILEIVRNLD